jgi:hypothetical protein
LTDFQTKILKFPAPWGGDFLFAKNKKIVLLLLLVFPVLSFPLAFDKVDKYIILTDVLNKAKYKLKSFRKNSEHAIKNREFVSIKNENDMYGLEIGYNFSKTFIGDRESCWATIFFFGTVISRTTLIKKTPHNWPVCS